MPSEAIKAVALLMAGLILTMLARSTRRRVAAIKEIAERPVKDVHGNRLTPVASVSER